MLLVIGGQAERVRQSADLLTVDQFKHEDFAITEDFSAIASASSQSGTTRSPVCEKGLGPEKVKERFEDKSAEIIQLSTKVRTDCSQKVCIRPWYRLAKKLKGFESCASSTTLAAASIKTVLKVQQDLAAVMKKAGAFPPTDTCSFALENFNAKSALASDKDPMEVAKGQIFGEGCNSQKYISELGTPARKTAERIVRSVEAVIKDLKFAQDSTQSADEELVDKIELDLELDIPETDLEEEVQSFLEGEDSTGSDSTDSGFWMAVLGFVMIFVGMILCILWGGR
jgi:hypothetical protein